MDLKQVSEVNHCTFLNFVSELINKLCVSCCDATYPGLFLLAKNMESSNTKWIYQMVELQNRLGTAAPQVRRRKEYAECIRSVWLAFKLGHSDRSA